MVGVGIEVLTRGLCFVVHTVSLYLLEEGLAFNQLRVVILLWLNSLYHACSIGVNPALSLALLAVVTHAPFESVRMSFAANTQERNFKTKTQDSALAQVIQWLRMES
jgi:hypothetical protein